MGGIKRQRGLTFIGWAFTLVLVGVGIFVVMKIFPIYMNQYKITSVLDTLSDDRGLADAPRGAVRERLRKLFNVNDIEYVDAADAEISTGRESRTVRIAYEVRQPFTGHIDVIFKFDNSVAVAGGGP